jgi:hypothetical protein
MPDFEKPYNVSGEEIMCDIDKLFELFDYVEWLQFVGGEIFLNKDLPAVYRHCVRYRDQFSKLILETNATLPLGERELEILQDYGTNCEIMISDYGNLSKNRPQFVEALEREHIPYRLKRYWGTIEEQHFGGWLDNTGLRDLGECEDEIASKAAGCAQVRLENMHCFRGRLHRCSNSCFMMELGIYEPKPDDFVDIHAEDKADEEKRDIIARFYSVPRTSCRFCTWKNGDRAGTPRYPAAEQLARLK